MSKELDELQRGIIEFEKELEDDCNNEWLKRVVAGMKKCYQRLEAIDKQRCGANVEKVIIDEFVPSNELDNAKPSEALDEIFNIIYNFDCGTTYEQDKKLNECRETIKQSLLKAQEQEKENAELKRVLEIINKKNVDIVSLKNALSVKQYNSFISFRINYMDYMNLTQEEFDLLKRYFE